jgi:hypothetical protein
MQAKGSKLKVTVEFKPNRLSDERWIEAYEITVPSRSFNIGSEAILFGKSAKRAKKQATA